MSWFNRSSAVSKNDDTKLEKGSEVDTPWNRAGREYQNTFLQLAVDKANWRFAFFVAMVIAGIAVGGVVYIGSQPKIKPYIVEVDQLGHTLAVRAVTEEDSVSLKKETYREMKDMIEYLRTVTTDIAANDANIHKGFIRLKGAATAYVRTELRKAPPNTVGESKTVQVKQVEILPISEKTWQVQWEEHSFSLNGEALGIERWKAIVTFEVSPSEKIEEFRENPVGFKAVDLHWAKVN